MGAGRNGRIGLGGEFLNAEHVVDELGLSVLGIDAPPAEAAALGDDHAVDAAVRYVDLGGDRERLVLDADHAVLRQASHAGEEQLRVTPDQGRSASHLRHEALGGAVIHRQHVVLGGLDQPEPLQLGEHLRMLGHEVASLAVVAVPS